VPPPHNTIYIRAHIYEVRQFNSRNCHSVSSQANSHLAMLQLASTRATDPGSSAVRGMLLAEQSDRSLGQRTDIVCCVKIGKSGSETLALLTMAEEVQGRARGCARRPRRWAAKSAKGRCKCGQSSDRRLGVRLTAEELGMGGKDPVSGLTRAFSALCMMC
jgi:hypothetical protein